MHSVIFLKKGRCNICFGFGIHDILVFTIKLLKSTTRVVRLICRVTDRHYMVSEVVHVSGQSFRTFGTVLLLFPRETTVRITVYQETSEIRSVRTCVLKFQDGRLCTFRPAAFRLGSTRHVSGVLPFQTARRVCIQRTTYICKRQRSCRMARNLGR